MSIAYPATSPASDQPVLSSAVSIPCGQGKTVNGCALSKKESKEAKAAFTDGLKLQHARHMQEALEAFDKAAQLDPHNVNYVTARELARQQLVFDDLQRGNEAISQGRQTEASADFRSALQLDPKNDFAQQRLRDVVGEWTPQASSAPRVLEDAGELRVQPDALKGSFHYRGNGTDLLTQVARAFGIAAVFDESVVSRPVQFDIDDVDFYSAMQPRPR